MERENPVLYVTNNNNHYSNTEERHDVKQSLLYKPRYEGYIFCELIDESTKFLQ